MSRVVVHPKYRTIGLGTKLVRETLSQAGTQYVEMPAVMAKYNPFAEKAGMRKVAEQSPSKEALKIAEILQMLGFSLRLLASENYNLAKLRSLSFGSIGLIKKVLSQYNHPRFMKYFSCDQPFRKKPIYSQKVLHADIETLAHLIKVCGFLLQTKVYLFWEKAISFHGLKHPPH